MNQFNEKGISEKKKHMQNHSASIQLLFDIRYSVIIKTVET